MRARGDEEDRAAAWNYANAPDTSDYHARGWNAFYAGLSKGRELEREAFSSLEAVTLKLVESLNELRDAACTAVNWKAVTEAKVGDAPWISQGDANDVDLAVLRCNEALSAYEDYLKGEGK